jgi:hypothetical protein
MAQTDIERLSRLILDDFGWLQDRFDRHDDRFDKIDEQLASHSQRFASIERELRRSAVASPVCWTEKRTKSGR